MLVLHKLLPDLHDGVCITGTLFFTHFENCTHPSIYYFRKGEKDGTVVTLG